VTDPNVGVLYREFAGLVYYEETTISYWLFGEE
jgi:hypothetical protein